MLTDQTLILQRKQPFGSSLQTGSDSQNPEILWKVTCKSPLFSLTIRHSTGQRGHCPSHVAKILCKTLIANFRKPSSLVSYASDTSHFAICKAQCTTPHTAARFAAAPGWAASELFQSREHDRFATGAFRLIRISPLS